MDQKDQYENAKNELSAIDCIMEPGVIQTVKSFLKGGGEPTEVVRLLTDNYRAMAQQVNLLAEWLILSGMSPTEVQELVENHLQQQLLKHFDPSKADVIFTSEGQTPAWLENMITYKKWRQLFYKLIEDYPDCVMLNFVIKLISDAGHQGEITNLSTAAAQLEVFARVIKTSIENLLEASDEHLIEQLPKLCEMVNHSEHTYLFSQSLLNEISQKAKTKRALICRIAQEVELSARARSRSVNTAWVASIPGASRFPRAIQAICNILQSSSLQNVDISILYKLYREAEPPPIMLLRCPAILDMFTSLLFVPNQSNGIILDNCKSKCVWLFGYAACVWEDWDKHGNRTSIERNEKEIEGTARSIESASDLLLNQEGTLNILAELPELFQCIRCPGVGLGVLRWVEATTTPKYLEKQVEGTPISLALVDEVATCHQMLHADVMRLLTRLLENPFPQMDTLVVLNLKKSVLDRMVHLVSRGYVLPVLKYISEIHSSEKIDASLVRHFVGEVLEIAAPPYSEAVEEMLEPLVKALQKHSGNPEEGPAAEFLAYIREKQEEE